MKTVKVSVTPSTERVKTKERQNRHYKFTEEKGPPSYMVVHAYANGTIVFLLNADGKISKVWGTNHGHFDIKRISVVHPPKVKELILSHIEAVKKLYTNGLPKDINLHKYVDKVVFYKSSHFALLENFLKKHEQRPNLSRGTKADDLVRLFKDLDPTLSESECKKIIRRTKH